MPGQGHFKTLFKRCAWRPIQRLPYPGRAHRIAQIVPRSILHESNTALIAVRGRPRPVERPADHPHRAEVLALVATGKVIDSARLSTLNHAFQSINKIEH